MTIKGAPDVLISRCSQYVDIDGQTKSLDEASRATIEQTKNKWSSQGKRVILLARKIIQQSELKSQSNSGQLEDEITHHAQSNLTLVGLVGIVDPPRDEIPTVVKTLRGAGIKIFMVLYFVHSSKAKHLLVCR